MNDTDPIIILEDADFAAWLAPAIGRWLPAAVLALALIAAPAAAEIEERLALVTAYTPSIAGGGAGTGLTATGSRTALEPYGVAACPTLLPFGSVVWIPGYREDPEKGGPWHLVDDTGAALRRSARKGILHLDVRMQHVASARRWGRRWLVVQVYVPDHLK